MTMVMPVALAVRGNVHQLWLFGGPFCAEAVEETIREILARVQQAFKGDGARCRAIVKEHRYGASLIELHEVRAGWVHRSIGGFGPGRFVGTRAVSSGPVCVAFRQWPDTCALVRGKNGEPDALLRHQVKNFAGHRGFGQPHAFRRASEAMFEVSDAPPDLGACISLVRQGHDDVVVDLRDRRAVAGVALHAGGVRIEDHPVGPGREIGQPTQQRGPEVEAHPRVVVHDADDLGLLVLDARGAVRGVALGGDPVIPVVVRRRGLLHLHCFQPGVFAWRLIEMSVHTDESPRSSGGIGWLGYCCRSTSHQSKSYSFEAGRSGIALLPVHIADTMRSEHDDEAHYCGWMVLPAARSHARHRYQLAIDRQGAHFFARRCICSGVASRSGVTFCDGLRPRKVSANPLRTP